MEVETSDGIIVVRTYDINNFESHGIAKLKFERQVYDLIGYGITSEYTESRNNH